MSDHLNLAMLDADGAIRETADAAGLDRSAFLKRSALAGGGLLVGGARFGSVVGTAEAAISKTRKSRANDVEILTYALTLEFLEAAFYEQAVAATAQVLEDTGVSAYLGQVANVFQDRVPAAAGTIATVEARHAAWIRFISDADPAPASFDARRSEAAILRAVGATNFIT